MAFDPKLGSVTYPNLTASGFISSELTIDKATQIAFAQTTPGITASILVPITRRFSAREYYFANTGTVELTIELAGASTLIRLLPGKVANALYRSNDTWAVLSVDSAPVQAAGALPLGGYFASMIDRGSVFVDGTSTFAKADGQPISRTSYATLFQSLVQTITASTLSNSSNVFGVSAADSAKLRQGLNIRGPGVQVGTTLSASLPVTRKGKCFQGSSFVSFQVESLAAATSYANGVPVAAPSGVPAAATYITTNLIIQATLLNIASNGVSARNSPFIGSGIINGYVGSMSGNRYIDRPELFGLTNQYMAHTTSGGLNVTNNSIHFVAGSPYVFINGFQSGLFNYTYSPLSANTGTARGTVQASFGNWPIPGGQFANANFAGSMAYVDSLQPAQSWTIISGAATVLQTNLVATSANTCTASLPLTNDVLQIAGSFYRVLDVTSFTGAAGGNINIVIDRALDSTPTVFPYTATLFRRMWDLPTAHQVASATSTAFTSLTPTTISVVDGAQYLVGDLLFGDMASVTSWWGKVTATTATSVTITASSFDGASLTIPAGAQITRFPRIKLEIAPIVTTALAAFQTYQSALISEVPQSRMSFTGSATNFLTQGTRQRLSANATATVNANTFTATLNNQATLSVPALSGNTNQTYEVSVHGSGDGSTTFNVPNLANATVPAGTTSYIRIA
jgi:hypothetical protein